MTATLYQMGSGIEARRVPVNEKVVFSYRFDTSDGDLYAERSWNEFWSTCSHVANDYAFVVSADISDFYNQIYHHTVENQLLASGFANQANKLFINTYAAMTAEVSRGIPVSPHTSHLVAEATLIPLDESLRTMGVRYCRYADDIVMFCQTKDEGRRLLFELARILDVQQRLQLQRGKTFLRSKREFHELCKSMIEDRPINSSERNLLEIIKRYTGGNPYETVWIGDLEESDLLEFTVPTIESILKDYLEADSPDYIRLRWFIRRLSQVGHPAGVNYCLKHFTEMRPAISEVCRYFISVKNAQQTVCWSDIGDVLENSLNDEVVRSSEYAMISIISLFASVPDLNHLQKLLRRYDESSPAVRREIILAACNAGATDWIRGLKESFRGMDDWSRSAFLYSTRLLIPEERKYFLTKVSPRNPWEEELIRTSKIA